MDDGPDCGGLNGAASSAGTKNTVSASATAPAAQSSLELSSPTPNRQHHQQQQLSETLNVRCCPEILALDGGDASDVDDDNSRRYRIRLSSDIMNHLEEQLNGDERCRRENDDTTTTHLSKFLDVMTRPPAVTICRINNINGNVDNRKDIINKLNTILNNIVQGAGGEGEQNDRHRNQQDLWDVKEDPTFHDVIQIIPRRRSISQEKLQQKKSTNIYEPWFKSEVDDDKTCENETTSKTTKAVAKIVLVDKICGEAVLRGSDIFVKGVVAASPGLRPNDRVAVYAHLPTEAPTSQPLLRGLVLRPIPLENVQRREDDISQSKDARKTIIHAPTKTTSSYQGTCVYLGIGIAKLPRKDIFTLSHGVAITMSLDPIERAFGLVLPPLHDVLPDRMMLQNLPSVLVAHTLNPQPKDTILDMCAAPGGKTSHLASLVKNDATIVACDKSRKKVLLARDSFQRFGATCIVPLVLDTTKCLSDSCDHGDKIEDSFIHSVVQQVLASAPVNAIDGLKEITHFPPCSFDRILLDPPCSALGLRPKLTIQQSSVKTLKRHATYQQRFVDVAVKLLKPGGHMTYSTCTVTSDENEKMVLYILEKYGDMIELLPVPFDNIGGPGLENCGLSDEQRRKVRRFDPTLAAVVHESFRDEDGSNDQNLVETSYSDTMGFFLALFRKKGSNGPKK
jgi:16S rRNA C967 or C1407 C5-methylase (RsmB/RsmF family)